MAGQVIDVPGYGPTEFPEGMSDEAIVAAIKRNMSPQAPASVVQPKNGDTPWASGFDIANIAGGIVEPLAKMATGFVARPLGQTIAMLHGAGNVVSGGKLGGALPEDIVKNVEEDLTYQPRTQAGRSESNPLNFIPNAISAGVQSIANPLADAVTGENAAPDSFRKMAGDATREGIVQAANIAMAKGLPTRQTPAALAEKSFADAARIDAAKLAVEKYGLSVNPVVSNPTKTNTVRVAAGGQEYVNALSRRHNEPMIGNILKEDLGIPKNTSLTSAEPFEAVREAAGQAKRQIQPMKNFVDDGTALDSIRDIAPKSDIGMGPAKLRVNKILSDAEKVISENPSGAKLIAEIETLRNNARTIYKATDVKPVPKAMADAYMGVANALEGMIERNLELQGKTDLLAQFREGRKKMAKSYVLQTATDLNTGIVDPMVIAKMTAKDNALTGTFADIGHIAGNFPESMSSKAGAPGGFKEFATTHATRTGAGGLTGYVVGGMFGQPLVGAAVGGALGEFGGRWYGNRLATNPAVQKSIAIPEDFRMLTGNPP